MLRLLKFIFTGDFHIHKWEIIREGKIGYTNEKGKVYTDPIAHSYVSKCTYCGVLKYDKFYVQKERAV